MSSFPIRNILLNSQQITGALEKEKEIVTLIKSEPLPKYEDNKPTDIIIGQKFTIVLPDQESEKITVKVMDKNNTITTDQIKQENPRGISIKLKNLSGKLYRSNTGEYNISCTADSWERVKQ